MNCYRLITLLGTALVLIVGCAAPGHDVAKQEASQPPPPPAIGTAPGTRLEAYPGGPVLIALPTGSFTMGSVDGPYHDERPVHTVRVTQAFAMGETELSFAQWDACVNDNRSALRCKYKPKDAWGRGAQPVMRVSYNDIVNEYLPWLNDKTAANPPYRLPTEAEWEYAARAGGKGEYSLGPNNSDKIDRTKANYSAKRTVPVNSFEPNAFGLYNMQGNVYEWTADCYNSGEYRERRKASGGWLAHNTSEENEGCSRVLRGGSWFDISENLRSTIRDNDSPNIRNNNTGLRVARTLLP